MRSVSPQMIINIMFFMILFFVTLSFVFPLKSPKPSIFNLLSGQPATCIDDDCNYILTLEEVPEHTSTLHSVICKDEDSSNGEFNVSEVQEWFFETHMEI
jgi:hypothetical protein